MDRAAFETLCRQIADVPWVFEHQYFRTARFETIGIACDPHHEKLRFDAWSGDDRLHMIADSEFSTRQLATAREFFAHLELEYLAREIAPNAPWTFGENTARVGGIIVWRPTWRESWSIGIGPSWIRAASVAGLIAAYREHRAKHEAARGVKTRQPKPGQQKLCLPPWIFWGFEAKPQPEWRPPALDDITIEHARNILACMADPTKYTLIAQWAKRNPLQAAQVLRRALETK